MNDEVYFLERRVWRIRHSEDISQDKSAEQGNSPTNWWACLNGWQNCGCESWHIHIRCCKLDMIERCWERCSTFRDKTHRMIIFHSGWVQSKKNQELLDIGIHTEEFDTKRTYLRINALGKVSGPPNWWACLNGWQNCGCEALQRHKCCCNLHMIGGCWEPWSLRRDTKHRMINSDLVQSQKFRNSLVIEYAEWWRGKSACKPPFHYGGCAYRMQKWFVLLFKRRKNKYATCLYL